MRTSVATSVIALCGLACSVFAAPNNQPNPDTDPTVHRDGCLTDHDAKVIMKRWVNFFVNFDPAVAQTGVTHGFKLISESANFLNPNFNFSLPLSTPEYDGKAAFIAGQSNPNSGAHNPGLTDPYQLFTIVDSDHGCNSFTFRWSGNFFASFGEPPVAGIDFVFVAHGSYEIERAYSEYNTGHFLSEVGCQFVGGACGTANCLKATCGAPPTSPKREMLGGMGMGKRHEMERLGE